MKKSIILLSASMLLVLTMNISGKAQNTDSPKVGIKGGVNFSNLYTDDAENNKMMLGFHAGLFAKLPISNNIAFQPEAYFTTKGAEVTYNNDFVNGTARFNLNYIEVPVLLVVNITDNFDISIGPYAGYLVSGKVKNSSNIDLFNFEDNINADDYNRFEVGFAAGAGFDLKLLSIGARYTYGFTKVGKERSYMGTTYTFPNANNGVLSVYASIPLF
jgi:hypothetical protein